MVAATPATLPQPRFTARLPGVSRRPAPSAHAVRHATEGDTQMRKLVLTAALVLTIAGSLGGSIVWGAAPLADDTVVWGN
jgi:hypothetical protein